MAFSNQKSANLKNIYISSNTFSFSQNDLTLDKLFAFLGELKQSPELEEPILAEMLGNLIALRDTNWGHADTANAAHGDAQEQVCFCVI